VLPTDIRLPIIQKERLSSFASKQELMKAIEDEEFHLSPLAQVIGTWPSAIQSFRALVNEDENDDLKKTCRRGLTNGCLTKARHFDCDSSTSPMKLSRTKMRRNQSYMPVFMVPK
jgi:hypothetical protein